VEFNHFLIYTESIYIFPQYAKKYIRRFCPMAGNPDQMREVNDDGIAHLMFELENKTLGTLEATKVAMGSKSGRCPGGLFKDGQCCNELYYDNQHDKRYCH
jgi:hypothetical protein